MGNVYGGGDNGIVKKDSEVIIGGVNTSSNSNTGSSGNP
jgi:hypothetical protein